ncbi:MAG: TetR/AcrR family transcriptional regulator, partial [Pararhizobium sp.]
RDRTLNAALQAALMPIREAALALGAEREKAAQVTADVFAHATGLLLLAHTGRIRLFGADPRRLMQEHLAAKLRLVKETVAP